MNVAVDLDGTLAEWRSGSVAPVGAWMEGAREAVEALLSCGHRVVVHSCRCTWEAGGGQDAVCEFVESGGFTPRLVVEAERAEPGDLSLARDLRPDLLEVGVWVGVGKPIAHWYVDDRAIHHDGVWNRTLWLLATMSGERVVA